MKAEHTFARAEELVNTVDVKTFLEGVCVFGYILLLYMTLKLYTLSRGLGGGPTKSGCWLALVGIEEKREEERLRITIYSVQSR